MQVVPRIESLRAVRAGLAQPVGLVPTMGNLHEGHMALVRACRNECASVIATIFVNPTQFGPSEDFASYPRTLADDLRQLETAGADVVFNPTVDEMYPDGQSGHASVSVPALANTLCGASRPGHFDGVATVVAKLFNIATPDKAFFGEKDWQQLTLIRTMAAQLDMPVQVVGVPTVRAASGLALSSRNGYLTDEERIRAALLGRALTAAKASIEAGDRDYAGLEARAIATLADGGFDVDYVAVRDAERLTAPDAATAQLRILAAARLGGARLIDNLGVDL